MYRNGFMPVDLSPGCGPILLLRQPGLTRSFALSKKDTVGMQFSVSHTLVPHSILLFLLVLRQSKHYEAFIVHLPLFFPFHPDHHRAFHLRPRTNRRGSQLLRRLQRNNRGQRYRPEPLERRRVPAGAEAHLQSARWLRAELLLEPRRPELQQSAKH